MQRADFEDLARLEDELWWFRGMLRITTELYATNLPAGPARVLDAGCGTGGMLRWLGERFGPECRTCGIDISESALEFCRSKGTGGIAQASCTSLPFPDNSFDLVTSFDVLVQIPGADGERAAFSELARVLKPGGYLFIRVAAYQWLFSNHDRAINTQRRYALGTLKERLRTAGFAIERASYANMFLLPVTAAWRLLKAATEAQETSDVQPLPDHLKWLDTAFYRLLTLESKLLRTLSLPCGTSAICIARKLGA